MSGIYDMSLPMNFLLQATRVLDRNTYDEDELYDKIKIKSQIEWELIIKIYKLNYNNHFKNNIC